MRQLQTAHRLKRTLRYSTTRDLTVHSESVGEHIFGLVFLAQYFLLVEEGVQGLNHERVGQIIVYHDLGEASEQGDIPYHIKTEAHEAQEREDAKNIFRSLPAVMRDVGLSAWHEYEERTNLEAQFVYALDKVEPLFELMAPVNERCHIRLHQTYESHIGKKLKATEKFPVMRRFVDVISADKKRRDVFWKE